MISTPALSGTLNMWVDENGVTHFSNQPLPDNTEHEKTKLQRRRTDRIMITSNISKREGGKKKRQYSP